MSERMIDELLTIRDLAERWGVSLDAAKRHVRRKGVPFIRIGTDADMRINWSTVRFRASAVAQWEQGSEEIFEGGASAAPPSMIETAGKPRFIRR